MTGNSPASDTIEFLSGLRRQGIHLRVERGSLVCNAPRGALGEALRRELAERKAEILGLLDGSGARTGEPGPRIPRRADVGPALLSFSQQRLWFVEKLEPGKAAYNLPLAFRLRGRLDVACLARALKAVAERHEVLRTTYLARDGIPYQLARPLVPELTQLDLGGVEESERARRVQDFLAEEAARTFDLENGPLVRVSLARLTPEEHVLCFVAHHSVFDGSSEPLLIRELTELYRAFALGESPDLPELPICYADFACWKRKSLDADALDRQISYWKQQLAGVAPVELPTDHPRPPLLSYVGATESRVLPSELSRRLAELAQREGVTLFMLMEAAFKVLLYRYSRQSDLAIATPINNRNAVETEGLFGFFVNMLVLRSQLRDDLSFRELLALERETCLAAYDHQDLPFERLVEELNPERDLSRTPLYQVILGFVDYRNWSEISHGAGLSWERMRCPTRVARTDLTLWIERSDSGLAGHLEYSTDLFEAATARCLLDQFEILLEGIAADPAEELASLPLLGEAERNRILLEWNATRAEYPRDRSVHALFEAQAERTPDRVAAVFPRAGAEAQVLRYRELDEQANRLASHLRRRGVAAGDVVGLYLERSPELLVALLGVLKSGASYLPLDPAFPAERLRGMLEDSEARVVLCTGSGRATLPGSPALAICLDGSEGDAIAREPAERWGGEVDPEALAYLIYTSGSTGRPKGVQIPHRAVVNMLSSMARVPGFSSRDVLLSVTTLSFDIAVLELLLPLVSGGRVVVPLRDEVRDGRRLAELLDEYAATVMQATPATWRLLLEAGWSGRSDLRILCGGEAMPRDLAAGLLERCASLWNMYGPSETTVWSTTRRIEMPEDARLVGRPIDNTQVYILDEALRPVPVGAVGELHIGGDGLARGYLKRPELDAERFVPNPFDPSGGTRLYKTGDRARHRHDGQIEFLGRLDHQVKLRGHRIELGEIEATLARHAKIRQAVVGVGQDAGGDACLHAYYTSEGDVELPAEELRELLKQTLPAPMLPGGFMRLDAFPLTPNRKIDRKSLPAFQAIASDPAYQAPRDELEAKLASLWSELLGLPRVGRDENFFDIGGYSLLVARVVARIQSEIGVELPLGKLFELPSIELLAGHIRSLSPGGKARGASPPRAAWQSVVEIQPEGSLPPLFGVHSTRYRTLAEHLGTDQPLYSLRYGLARTTQAAVALPSRIQDLAAHYVEEMRLVQPDGPYHLMGLCIGGLIAFEMAHQLRAQREEVALLAIFDALAPQGRIALPIQARIRNLMRVEKSEILHRVHERLRPRPSHLSDEESARRKYRSHVPSRTYPGPVDLFRPADRISLTHRFAPDLGWGRLVGEGLRVHSIPGEDHTGMFREPCVRLVAAALRACLAARRGASASDLLKDPDACEEASLPTTLATSQTG
jgi:amino acid adenylation domain-containing protein